MLLGIHLTLLIGGQIPAPAPFSLVEALESVEVTHNDQGKSGFTLVFQVGRSGPLDLLDYGLLRNPLVKPFNRVIVMVRFNLVPRVLIDGFITEVQLSPSADPGGSTLTLTGEDVSVMMDLEEKSEPFAGQPEPAIVENILKKYPLLRLVPRITPPLSLDIPVPTRRIPHQTGQTDLAYLTTLAERYGFVFYVTPASVPGANFAYWGPPDRLALPQRALSVNMGPDTNVESINFTYNALAPLIVDTLIQDSDTNLITPVITPPLVGRMPLALKPGVLVNQPNVRKIMMDIPHEDIEGMMRSDLHFTRQQAQASAGLNIAMAMARAQGMRDAASDNTVTATGDLDALRYGDVLTARGIVGLRGVGLNYDGNYYVKSVSHSIRKGEYRQRFTLQREGTGSLTPFVRP